MINQEGFLSAIGWLVKSLFIKSSQDGNSTDSKMSKFIQSIDTSQMNTCLTAGLKKSTIISRVFIEESLNSQLPETVMKACLDFSHIYYASLVMMAFGMNQVLEDGRTVSDVLTPVSSENNKVYIPLDEQLMLSLENNTVQDRVAGVKDVEAAPPNTLPFGKLISYTLNIPQKDGSVRPLQITVCVRINPYYIQTPLVESILGEKQNLGWVKRFVQWKVGEISFWKDFIFGMDIVKDEENKLKRDSSGGYHEYINMIRKKNSSVSEKFFKVLGNMFFNKKAVTSSNIANSVFIISHDTVMQAKQKYGIDLYNTSQRNRFFTVSFTMLLIIVDDTYSRISIMMNGFDDVSEYTFNQFMTKTKTGSNDMVGFLKQLLVGRL